MKTRILSALVGLIVLAVAVLLYDTAVLAVFPMLLAGIAAYEMLHACGCLSARDFSALTILAACFFSVAPQSFFGAEAFVVAALALLCFWLRYHGKLTAEQLGFSFGVSVAIACSFRCMLFLRDTFGHAVGLYALMVALVAAWMSDTGAYFAGRAFGRHKLCPQISPHKTVEGALGGVLGAVLGQAVLAAVFAGLYGLQIRLSLLLALSPVLTVISILGDLSASVIKRDTGIKDYGKLMPGHGGVLDRFDSVIPLLPLVTLLFCRLSLVR